MHFVFEESQRIKLAAQLRFIWNKQKPPIRKGMKTFLIFNSHFQSHSKTNLLTPSVNGNFFFENKGEFAKIQVSFLMTQFPSKFNISSQSGSDQFFHFLILWCSKKLHRYTKEQPNDFFDNFFWIIEFRLLHTTCEYTLLGRIDVSDGCWRQNVLVTTRVGNVTEFRSVLVLVFSAIQKFFLVLVLFWHWRH